MPLHTSPNLKKRSALSSGSFMGEGDVTAGINTLFRSFGSDPDDNMALILEFALGAVPGDFVVYHHFDMDHQKISTHLEKGSPKKFRRHGRLNGSICYEALVTDQLPYLFINDLRQSPYWESDPDLKRYGLQAYIGCPVIISGRMLGSLALYDRKPGDYNESHVQVLVLLAQILAFIEDRTCHEQDLERKWLREKMLSDISASAISDEGIDHFLSHSLEIIGSAMDADAVTLYSKEIDRRILEDVAHWRSVDMKKKEARLAVCDLASLVPAQQAMQKGRVVHCTDIHVISDPEWRNLLNRHNIKSLLFVPLSQKRDAHGFCSLLWQRPIRESDDDHSILNAAMQTLAQRLSRHVMATRLDESEALVDQLFQLAPAAIYRIDLKNQRILNVNDHLCHATGYSREELLKSNPADLLTTESLHLYLERLAEIDAGKPVSENVEFEIITKNGEREWGRFHIRHLREDGQIVGAHVVANFITEQKKAQEALQDYQKNLESKVMARTVELAQANQALREENEQRIQTAEKLKASTERLKEMNTAMRVLLDKRMEDHQRTEELIRLNLKELIDPYLTRLEDGELRGSQRQLVDLIRVNLDEVVGASMPELSSKYYIFSPNELQVVNLIRKGKTTKEIARLLNLSTRTVESYRNSIRKKLGIKNKKVNLRTYLSSI